MATIADADERKRQEQARASRVAVRFLKPWKSNVQGDKGGIPEGDELRELERQGIVQREGADPKITTEAPPPATPESPAKG